MITVQLYKKGDWAKIKDSTEPFMPIREKSEFDEIAARGIAVTATENDKAMACGGVAFLNEHEGTVWVKMSKDCAKRPVMWARAIKETFGLMVESAGNVKITTYILENFCKGEKLARLIGLKKTDETAEHNGNTYNKYTVVI